MPELSLHVRLIAEYAGHAAGTELTVTAELGWWLISEGFAELAAGSAQ